MQAVSGMQAMPASMARMQAKVRTAVAWLHTCAVMPAEPLLSLQASNALLPAHMFDLCFRLPN
jgi:hypothetical protein